MYLCRIQSDQLYTWSDEYPERAHCRLTKTSQRSCAPTAPAASGPARLPHRALQTVWQAGMQMHRRPRPWSQVLSVDKLPQRCWIVSSSRRSCRFYNASGTGRFLSIATGFRPGRSTHQAVSEAQQHIVEGHRWVVDLDLEKFFDRVNHDKLMGQVAKRITDSRMRKLIRAFLNAGVMENGLVSPTVEGTPQGGPLSPLLSNLVLDELDQELERRGHRFVRYADDCNIYVRSERAGKRVMESVVRFITDTLKLKVNSEKSAVAKPQDRKFLGFSFTRHAEPKRRIAPKAVERFKKRVREITSRTRGVSFAKVVEELTIYLRGWRGYFSFCQTPSVLQSLEEWVRRRLRSYLWKAWRTGGQRFAELRKRGVGLELAAQTAGSSHGPWCLSASPALSVAFPNAYFDSLGLPRLAVG